MAHFSDQSRPILRKGLSAALLEAPDRYLVYDPLRLTPTQLPVTRQEIEWMELMTGTRTLLELHIESSRSGSWNETNLEHLQTLTTKLDQALFLKNQTFEEYVLGPNRRPACIGVYPEDPDAIRDQLQHLFTGPGGPGLPRTNARPGPHGRLRAALLPHMDYRRGGVTYGWGFQELLEQSDANLFVIVATSHYSGHRFTLTRKNYETPLGVVETDQSYVEALVREYGSGLLDDPFAHLPEHSIELEVLLLQYLYESHPKPIRIVPLLVSSFRDCVQSGLDPGEQEDIAAMVQALRVVEQSAGEPVCYLISGDLAHIGPKFRDPDPVSEMQLAESRKQDDRLLRCLTRADVEGYHKIIQAEEDHRRICGFPPTWLTLQVLKPRQGRVLHYQQYVHPEQTESVSFAAAAFYQ